MLGAGVDVNHGRLHKGMAKLLLDGKKVRTTMKEAGREAVPQEVRVDALGEARPFCRRPDQLAQVLLCVGLAAAQADEEPILRPAAALAHGLGQNRHTRRGDVRVTVLLGFGGLDV